MKRLFTLCTLLFALTMFGTAVAQQSVKSGKLGRFDTNEFSMQLPVKANEWKSTLRHNPFEKAVNGKMRKNIVTQGTTKIGPVNSFGALYAPDGTEWIYTSSFDFDDNGNYTAAHLTIYDQDHKVIGTIDDKFELAEHQTGVNSVMIDPNVTQKFFNVNDKYEVILFIHATTDDYMGCVYQHIFSLAPDQKEPLLTIQGNEILIADMAIDKFSEKKQMVMMREENTEDNDYIIHYDIYDRAGWGSLNAPVLLHTFSISYDYLAGSGGNAFPITVQNVGGKAHYAIARYEKPFFDQSVPVFEEPVVTPDNNFIIDLYTQDDFDTPYKTITIPMETEEGFYYTFPGIGAFLGNDDFSFGLFGNDKEPYFIVSHDNYITATDDFQTSIYLYDQNGNRVKTLISNVSDYLQMSDVPGEGLQFCFVDSENEVLKFMNLPSCEVVAELPFVCDDRQLSMSLDRVPANGGYNIVIAGSQGEVDNDGTIYHPIGYFNADGTVNHWDLVNLGADVVMAQPAIVSSWLNPYLFDTDSDADYMFLAKVPSSAAGSTTKNEEHFWILNAAGEIHADFGPSAEMGAINSMGIYNASSEKPVLATTYYDWQTNSFVLNFNDLPFSRFNAGGKGTAADPYVISTPGDLMQICNAPNAHYILVADIDCEGYPFAGNKCEFTGSLDGQGHTISNLCISGSSLIGHLIGSAEVKNLTLDSPVIYPSGSEYCGFIATTATYDGSNIPAIYNVHVINPVVDNDEYAGAFGTIIGQLTTGATVYECSVTGAEINLPSATVGGIVGATSPSGGNINAVSFNGSLCAAITGGIIGEAPAVALQNAHVNADIVGTRTAGGIIGYVGEYGNNRGTFTNCYVEGNLTSTNEKDAAVGGIAGTVETGENIFLTNNVVALETINYEASVATKSAHRIAGHTCADEPGEILWEDPWWDEFRAQGNDPYEHQELWPRANVAPDKGLANNHAVYPLAPVNGDEEMAKDATSVEGKTAYEKDCDDWQNFFVSLGFKFGDNDQKPWAWVEGKPVLWFEPSIKPDAIKTVNGNADFAKLTFANGKLRANGTISVFTANGMKVTSALNTLSTSQLKPGMYIATCGKQSVKFTVK